MYYARKSAALCVLLLLLSACGQRGPLYIPQDEPAKTQPESSVENSVTESAGGQ